MPKVYNRHHAGVPDDAVSIERGTDWGNPFRIGPGATRQTVLQQYREWVQSDPGLIRQIRTELTGKDLVCCCKPRACHGDVLLELANPCGLTGAENP